MEEDGPVQIVVLEDLPVMHIRQELGLLDAAENAVITLQTDLPVAVGGADAGAADHHLAQLGMVPGVFQLDHPVTFDHAVQGLIDIVIVAVVDAAVPELIALLR